jgi:hypothetical protein
MTVRDDLDRHVAVWLATDAPTSPPEHLLGEVLAQTARTRRRPAWRIPERWIPVSAITSRLATPPGVPWRTIAVATLLVALLAGAIFVAGSLRNRVPPPFGPAANGALYYSQNGDLMVADSPTATPRVLFGDSANDEGVLLSPDGTRLVFVRGGIGHAAAELWTAAADGSTPRKLADVPTIGWAEWSPQSDELAVMVDGNRSIIQFIDTETGSIREIDTGLVATNGVVWRPSDGAQLAFRGRDSTLTWGLYLINRDGTGLKRLELDPGFESDPYYAENWDAYFQGPAWSADGTQLLYQQLEPMPASPAGPGFRNRVATIDTDGVVTGDRILEYNTATDDDFLGTWLSPDTILFQTVDNSRHRLFIGSVAEGHGPARDLGLDGNEWIPYAVSPDTQSAIVTLPGAVGGPPNIVSADLATGAWVPTQFATARDPGISWQRLAER